MTMSEKCYQGALLNSCSNAWAGLRMSYHAVIVRPLLFLLFKNLRIELSPAK